MIQSLEHLPNNSKPSAKQEIGGRLAAEYNLSKEAAAKVMASMADREPETLLQIRSKAKKGREIIYLTNFIIDELPDIHGASSLVLIAGPKRIVNNPNLDYIWEAFGSMRRIPDAKYMTSVDDRIDFLKVGAIVFK